MGMKMSSAGSDIPKSCPPMGFLTVSADLCAAFGMTRRTPAGPRGIVSFAPAAEIPVRDRHGCFWAWRIARSNN